MFNRGAWNQLLFAYSFYCAVSQPNPVSLGYGVRTVVGCLVLCKKKVEFGFSRGGSAGSLEPIANLSESSVSVAVVLECSYNFNVELKGNGDDGDLVQLGNAPADNAPPLPISEEHCLSVLLHLCSWTCAHLFLLRVLLSIKPSFIIQRSHTKVSSLTERRSLWLMNNE